MEEADKGYIVHRTVEVSSTLPSEETESNLSPLIKSKSANLRKAQLALSVLVELGMIEQDFNDPEWHLRHEAASRAIARVFDAVEIKV